MEKDPNILKRKITIMELSVIGSVAIILLNIFRWSLVDVLTPFLEPFVEIIVGGFFLILLIRSIVTAISRFKKEGKKALVPLIINAATLLIVFFVPFTRLTIALDFRMNLSAREQVVGMIQNKNLVPNVSYNKELLALPKQYQNLSKGGGEVLVEPTEGSSNIFFFTFRGVTDNFSGFVYRSDDKQPSNGDFGCDYVNLIKMREYWYWMSCS